MKAWIIGVVLALAATVPALAYPVHGVVLEADTGRPLAGVPVAAGPESDTVDALLAGDAAPAATDLLVQTTTDADGAFTLDVDDADSSLRLDVFGSFAGLMTFHGTFAPGTVAVPPIRLIAPTLAERHALEQINAFRRAPGGAAGFGVLQPLVFDQNLALAARYWAAQERAAHTIGHTCAQLGNPRGCIEFNAYFHALPGAPPDDDAGQNAAFDSDVSWSDPDRLFEIEGRLCRYNWRACGGGADGSDAQTGHYVNLMSARYWIGFGESAAAGDGVYFAQNLL